MEGRRQSRWLRTADGFAVLSCRPVQLALRISSVTAIGADCSIVSTATVSTTGATGAFTFRTAFFAGAGLGLAFAFAALVTLRALPRLGEFPLRSFARFCTLDAFLRLAMIRPALVGGPQRMMSDQKGAAMDQASLSPDFMTNKEMQLPQKLCSLETGGARLRLRLP
jgi:hypothetical protein